MATTYYLALPWAPGPSGDPTLLPISILNCMGTCLHFSQLSLNNPTLTLYTIRNPNPIIDPNPNPKTRSNPNSTPAITCKSNKSDPCPAYP